MPSPAAGVVSGLAAAAALWLPVPGAAALLRVCPLLAPLAVKTLGRLLRARGLSSLPRLMLVTGFMAVWALPRWLAVAGIMALRALPRWLAVAGVVAVRALPRWPAVAGIMAVRTLPRWLSAAFAVPLWAGGRPLTLGVPLGLAALPLAPSPATRLAPLGPALSGWLPAAVPRSDVGLGRRLA